MLLAVDIGNTNIKIGLFEGDEHKITWSISTGVHRMPDEYAVMLLNLLRINSIPAEKVTKGAISCVVPPLLTIFTEVFERYFNITPLVIGPGVKTGFKIRMDNPREVGRDLIANAAGALTLYKPPIIIVALGTATAFETINKDGDYIGGALAPGLGIAAEALYSQTAALPRVELIRPRQVIGTNTQAAMQSGIMNGYAGFIDRVVDLIQEELGEKATVVATGGYCTVIAKEAKTVDIINPDLTLIGIKVIHAMNHG
ncbi:MAG: type III pantothenate kinase [Dehalococcoidales bacterium]|nr:type III pantothenate kinase [Dehalococcoidales bacterium]